MKLLNSLIFASFSLMITGAFATPSSYAFGNPLIQTCVNYGGNFVLLEPGQVQDLPVCVFGSAEIGALDLVNHRAGCSDQAASTYLAEQSSTNPSSVCAQNGAQEITGQNPNSIPYDLCQFRDGSIIDTQTLALGPSASQNASLTTALTAPPEGPSDPSECRY